MRVLLINPPYPVCESLTMPLGLLYLAARLEEAGNQVTLEDLQVCRFPLSRIARSVGKIMPRIVGITSFSMNVSLASRILKRVKELDPRIITAWGGPHVTFDDCHILRNHPWVDVVIRGEGEETLLEIVQRTKSGQGFEGVAGATWKRPDGDIHRNPPRPFCEDLDRLPRPAWHLLNLSQYRAFNAGASLFTSRGCPHRCVFCVGRKMIGAKGRFRDPAAVADEMEALAALGFRRLRVEDDLFTFRRERAVAICREMLARALPVRWRAYARVDTVDPQLLQWMKRAGCERILFGAESGNPQILASARKGITPEETRRAIEWTREAGIGVLASFVLGLPGETPDTLRQTLEFAQSLQVPYTLNLLTPYVGTEIRERSSELGIRILSNDWRLYGQGRALTATPQINPWHLSRAAGRFRRGLKSYLDELLRKEGEGTLDEGSAEELRRNREWAFLRKLIGGEFLERFGNLSAGPDNNGLKGLAACLAPHLGMPEDQVREHLEPHVRGGHIGCARHAGSARWSWT